MKNRTLKSLSVLLSICMLGTSPVSATDFSDGSDFTEDSTQTQEDTTTSAADSADNFSADDATDDTAAFDSEDEIFTDEETNGEFSSDEAENNTEKAVDAGPLDSSVSAQYLYNYAEADIESYSSKNASCTVYNGNNLEYQDYSVWSSPISS